MTDAGKASITKLFHPSHIKAKSTGSNPLSPGPPSKPSIPPTQRCYHPPRSANMTKFNEFLSIYKTFCEGSDDVTPDQVDGDQDPAPNQDDTQADELYAMLTDQAPNKDNPKHRPGNINCLLRKPQGST